MVGINAHFEDRNLAKRPTIHNFISRNMHFASIEVDLMDLPDTGNARRYDNAREYDILSELKKVGIHMKQIFEIIPTDFSGHSTNVGQGDSQGATFSNNNSRPIYMVSYNFPDRRWKLYEVMMSGSGNHRNEIEEVATSRYVQHVKFRVLVIGA